MFSSYDSDNIFFKDIRLLSRVSNHPVHMIDKNGSLSPSAFIPFCSFGGDFDAMGAYHSNFKVPVCNSFQPTVKDEQICYELDLEKYKNELFLVKQLQEGLVLYLDFNEDKQLTVETNKENSASVNVDTISMMVLTSPDPKPLFPKPLRPYPNQVQNPN